MRRVVITGMGITSCLGNDLDTVSAALRESRAGITALADHADFTQLPWSDAAVDLIVTEKDAIKLNPTRLRQERPLTRVWVAGLDFHPEQAFWAQLDAALNRLPLRPTRACPFAAPLT